MFVLLLNETVLLNISTKHSPIRSKFKRSNVVSISLKGAVNDSQHGVRAPCFLVILKYLVIVAFLGSR